MKRSILVLCVLFLAAPLYSAERSATADPSLGAPEKEFPRVSASQLRRPMAVAATDDGVICGFHPDMPNCDFRCRDGVTELNADGTQRVICWGTPIYPEAPSGVCNRYYECSEYGGGGMACTFSGDPYKACIFLEGNVSCSECNWY